MSTENKKSIVVSVSGASMKFVKRIDGLAQQTAATIGKVTGAGANKVVSFKARLDEMWENGIDDLYELHRPIAVENLARLRTELPSASPFAIREHLGNEYRAVIFNETLGAELNLSATKLLVLSLAEVHGTHIKSVKGKRLLVAQALLATSTPIVFVVRNAPVLWSFLRILVSAFKKTSVAQINVASKKAAGAAQKVAVSAAKQFAPGIANRAIKADGVKRLVTDAIIRYAIAILGPAPKTWSDATAPSSKKPPVKESGTTTTVQSKAKPKTSA